MLVIQWLGDQKVSGHFKHLSPLTKRDFSRSPSLGQGGKHGHTQVATKHFTQRLRYW